MVIFTTCVLVYMYSVRKKFNQHMEQSRAINYLLKSKNYKYTPKG